MIHAAHGLWSSPISPALLADAKRLSQLAWDTQGATLAWLEGRSARNLVAAWDADSGDCPRDATSDSEVRGEVGYGGGDFTLNGGQIYFAQAKSGRIRRQALAGGPSRAITPEGGKAADFSVSPDGRWLVYVHADGDDRDRLLVVDTEGRELPRILAQGRDFYMSPCWRPDGKAVAWIAWDHPQMPWDGTELWMAEFRDGRAENPRLVAGSAEVSIAQPEFAPDGRTLCFLSDRSGWTHLHAFGTDGERPLTSGEREFGNPRWVYGTKDYAILDDGSIFLVSSERGFSRGWLLTGGELKPVESLAGYSRLAHPVARGRRVALLASGSRVPARIVVTDPTEPRAAIRIVARSCAETLLPESLSEPEAVSWPTSGGEMAHGLYYPPASATHSCGGKPPLVVLVHGGPTSQATARWALDTQFFASRGYGVLQLNYRGSTGYGREYMRKLRGRWGELDVEDAVSGKRFLEQSGRTSSRAVIMGGSAGGYTVLQAMVDYPEEFTAGVNLYGISDQFTAATETHKFESRYNDSLLGTLPEATELYRRRSPLFHADKIRRPLAVFQGEDDQVVRKDQSERIVAALRARGVPCVYHCYPGEGHGWRKSETIDHFYREVLAFLKQHVVFGG